jgi:hypothetical protein
MEEPYVPHDEDAYRLWFEFYKLACTDDRQAVRDALKATEKEFGPHWGYKPWGNVRSVTFKQWWPRHKYLFTELGPVDKLISIEDAEDLFATKDDYTKVFSVDFVESRSVLLDCLKKEVDFNIELLFGRQRGKSIKSQFVFPGRYRLWPLNREPKLFDLENMLVVYRDVYLGNETLHPKERLQHVKQHFEKIGRRPPQFAGEKGDSTAQLARYIRKAKAIVLNVANRRFPGNY